MMRQPSAPTVASLPNSVSKTASMAHRSLGDRQQRPRLNALRDAAHALVGELVSLYQSERRRRSMYRLAVSRLTNTLARHLSRALPRRPAPAAGALPPIAHRQLSRAHRRLSRRPGAVVEKARCLLLRSSHSVTRPSAGNRLPANRVVHDAGQSLGACLDDADDGTEARRLSSSRSRAAYANVDATADRISLRSEPVIRLFRSEYSRSNQLAPPHLPSQQPA